MLFLTFSALVFVPRFICSLEALRLIFAMVTLQTAVLAVMTAVPPLTARTFPAAFTVTTDGRLLLQVTVLSAASAGSTPALRTAVLLGSSTSSVLFRVIPDASIAGVTVTLQTAVFPPAVAVMFAVPSAAAVTVPSAATVATVSLSDFHVTVLSAAFSGSTAAVSFSVAPAARDSSVLFKVTDVTAISFGVTVTLQVTVFPPAVAVMFAVPSAAAVATVSLSDFHVTVLSVAFSGSTAAVSFSVAPAARVSSVLFKVMDVTSTDGVPGFPPGAV